MLGLKGKKTSSSIYFLKELGILCTNLDIDTKLAVSIHATEVSAKKAFENVLSWQQRNQSLIIFIEQFFFLLKYPKPKYQPQDQVIQPWSMSLHPRPMFHYPTICFQQWDTACGSVMLTSALVPV
jgi:hypothetical protein